MNGVQVKEINKQADLGPVGRGWLKMLMRSYDALSGANTKTAEERWPYLNEHIIAPAVDRKWLKPMIDEAYREYGGLAYLASVARFSNPASLGHIFNTMMQAPTLRHGLAYLAVESGKFDGKLDYSFSNYESQINVMHNTFVVEWSHRLSARHQREASSVVQAAGLVKYFGMLHGEQPAPSQVWVELDLPYEDSYILERILGVPVSFSGRNCIHLSIDYAGKESLHSDPDSWSELALDYGTNGPKQWADKLAICVSCWDYSSSKPTLDAIATQFNMTGPTLRNRLKAGGYVCKDVMKKAEMERVRNSLRNGMTLSGAQTTYGYRNLRDLRANYKKHLGENINQVKRALVKDTKHYV